jgi:hypothetical protein
MSMQCGGSHAMAIGVKMHPRALASATVVPPHEQDARCAARILSTEVRPMVKIPQSARRISTVFEKMTKRRFSGRSVGFGRGWGEPFSLSKLPVRESSSLFRREL